MPETGIYTQDRGGRFFIAAFCFYNLSVMISKVHALFFSPTLTSKKVVEAIAKGVAENLNIPFSSTDITTPADRINELAHKKKSVGLTAEELEEQARLRAMFLEDFRKRFIAQLENIEIVDEDDPRLKTKGPLS